MKTYTVIPAPDMKAVRTFLDSHGISYNVDETVIFANMEEIPPELQEIATVNDPVFSTNSKEWYFCCEDEVIGPYKTEHDARTHFVQYISWSGEFINNKGKQ